MYEPCSSRPGCQNIISNVYTFFLGRPHVESFNFMLDEGMKTALKDLKPLEFEIPETSKDRYTKVEVDHS